MRNWKRLLKHQAKRLVAITVMVILFCLAQLPSLSAKERETIASRFEFTRLPMPELVGRKSRRERAVHPSLQRYSIWFSLVGAAIALNDLDGDRLSNDICYVDSRSDRVIITPVPGTGERYQPFELKPTKLVYDETTMAPMGCVPGDLNEDGLMDLLVYYWGRTPVAFLHQDKAEDYTTSKSADVVSSISGGNYLAQELIPNSQSEDQNLPRWNTNAATFADLDGDGHNDLILGNYYPDGAEILNVNGTGTEEMQDSMSRAYNGGQNRLFLWSGATRGARPTVDFQEVEGVLEVPIAQAWTLAVGTADLDGDLLPEIYFANDFGPDRLLHNRSTPGKLNFAVLEGEKSLTTPNSKVLGNDSFKGMGVDFADVNHDGWLDIYVSNIANEYALEESHFLFTSTGNTATMQQGIAPYVDRSESLGVSRSGWGWDTKFGDFDNDGEWEVLQATGLRKGEVNRWPELQELGFGNDELVKSPKIWFRFQDGDDVSGHNPNPFFVRGSDGRYYDFAKELGLADPFVTRGIATADVDGDGDLDFAIANQWEDSYFYRNDSPHPGAFLGLKLWQNPNGCQLIQNLKPKITNIVVFPAIGATATVHLPDGRQLVAQVDGGNGHSGVRSPELHFGLGKIQDDTPLQVDLQWRNTSGQVHRESLSLSPGWHQVLLDEAAKPFPSCSDLKCAIRF